MEQPLIKVERLECDEFIITIDGRPIGQSLHERDMKLVAAWLKTAWPEIAEQFAP